MKRLLIILLSIALVNPLFAYTSAKLRMKIAGPIKDNRYFLCVTNIGCVSILAGNQGKIYPLGDGHISNIFMINIVNKRMYTQPLPGSCEVSIKNNQTLSVSGKLIEGSNNTRLSNLQCRVS